MMLKPEIAIAMMLCELDEKFAKGFNVVEKLSNLVIDDDFGAKIAKCSEEELDKLTPHVKAIEEILKNK